MKKTSKKGPMTDDPMADEPVLPGADAVEDDLGTAAPTTTHLAEDEGFDSALIAGVTAAGESDEEAGTSVAPEYPVTEIAPEIGVDSVFTPEGVPEPDDLSPPLDLAPVDDLSRDDAPLLDEALDDDDDEADDDGDRPRV